MITWMQRHRKWLVITIWISTISFIGAGATSWGQNPASDKGSVIAEVGKVEITQRELQKEYSRLYSQYNQIFQGNFSKEQAESFGLQKQAFKQLVNQSYVLNLAKDLKLEASDKEVFKVIEAENAFTKDGKFSKDIYKKVLQQNNMSMKEFENDLRNDIVTRKVINLIQPSVSDLEQEVLNIPLNIADKIEYKILSDKNINIETDEKSLKTYWEMNKNSYMDESSFDIEYFVENIASNEIDASDIADYYESHKNDYVNEEGMRLTLDQAQSKVKADINAKETKKTALKKYIKFKKGEGNFTTLNTKISLSSNIFNNEVYTKLNETNLLKPVLKPIKVGNTFVVIKLIKKNESTPKSYESVKEQIKVAYILNQKKLELLKLAKTSADTFKGKTSVVLNPMSDIKIEGLDSIASKDFINKLFKVKTKRGYIESPNGDVVLYNILEQNLLSKSSVDQTSKVMEIKSKMLNSGLIKSLESKYSIEVFVAGLE